MNRKLGEFIKEVDVRNKNLSITLLLGVSNEKYFMPSIANIVGTDLSNYKIVRKNQFAFGTVTSRNGDKISIALLKEEECIVSSSYVVFEIIDTNRLDPDYLDMWFRRDEFDRYVRFMSHGSVREIFSLEKMKEVELPVPDIAVQKQYVNQYKALNNAIKLKEQINNNLLEMGLSIFKEYKLKNKNQKTCLDSLIDIKKGKNPEELFTDSSSERIRYLNMDAFSQNTFTYVNRSKQVLVDEFDYSMVMDGSSSGKIVFGLSGAIASTLGKIEVQNENFKYLVFFALKEIENGHKDHNTGSAIPHANKSLVKGIEITYSDSSLKGINGKLLEIFTSIVRNKKEMNQLQGVKLLLLTRLSSQQ